MARQAKGMIPTYLVSKFEDISRYLAIQLTVASSDEYSPYGNVKEFLADQMQSSADYGMLVMAMLDYFDDDNYFSDVIYDALSESFGEYLQQNWQRICAGDERFTA